MIIALIGVFGTEMGQMQVQLTLMLVMMILLVTAIVRPFSNLAQQEHLLQSLELTSLMGIFLTLWAASVFSTYPKCEDPNAAGQTIAWCDFLSVVVGLVDFIILIGLISCFIAVKFFGVNFGKVLLNNTRVGKSLSRWTSMRSFRKTQKNNVQSTSNETKNETKTTIKNRDAEIAAAAAEIELTSIVSETTEQEEEVVEEEIVEEGTEAAELEQQQEEEWVKTVDPNSGHTYLYNPVTKESKWEDKQDDGLEEKKLETSVNPLHVVSKEKENDGDWKYMFDETNQAGYWLNSKTGESEWAAQ